MYIGEYNCLKGEYELDIIIKQECEKYWKISDVERENCKEKLRFPNSPRCLEILQPVAYYSPHFHTFVSMI